MKYKSIAAPQLPKGLTFRGKSLVVPNQSMSLEEILSRFTRGEPLEIGREGAQYDDGPEDLEKVSHMDLVDRAEFVDKLKQTQKRYDKQEARKKGEEKTRLEKLAIDKIAAEKKAAEEAAKAK